jgi:hypothetical protein
MNTQMLKQLHGSTTIIAYVLYSFFICRYAGRALALENSAPILSQNRITRKQWLENGPKHMNKH